MNRNTLGVIAISALLIVTISARAQTVPIRPSYEYPSTATGGVEMGGSGFFMSPFIGVAAGHDSNLFYRSSNEKASNLVVTSPGLRVDGRRPGMVFLSTYQAQIGRYTSSSDDDYVDQTWHNQLDTAFDQRTFLRLGYDYARSHDPRGSTDRAISTRPDVYKLSTPSATFAFGAPGAQGRVELYGDTIHKDYLNNKETTRFSDRKQDDMGAAFYWRVAPRTYALVEARQTNIDYQISNPFGGTEYRYYVGASWEATAATTGTLKVGRLRREFDGDLTAATASSWEALVTWMPRTYSRFDFYTTRQTNESTGLGTFILSSIGGVLWNHQWSSYLSTNMNLRYQRDQYEGFDRTDNTRSLGLKVGYRFRPWLTLGAEYDYSKRTSNLPLFDYDKSLYLLTATATM